jgi:hypothetical protein
MKGNRPIGWGNWNEGKGKRGKSELQAFIETILALIDPYRADPPASRYYAEVKRYLRQSMPG